MNRGEWENGKILARGVLRDKTLRRRWLSYLLGVLVMQIILGNWLIPGWLAGNRLYFAAWWSCCALLSLVLFIFAMLDLLLAIKESRTKK